MESYQLSSWTIAIIITILIVLILKVIANLTLGVCKSKNIMTGKTIVLTGCVSGIGRETAKDLAARGARLIMADINFDDAIEVRDEIVKETKNDNIVVKKVDMSSFESVRAFAEEIKNEESRLDVLINNAGTCTVFQRKLSVDGYELTMATNQFGPFLLTYLLLDLLKRSAPSRIVITASVGHHFGWLNLENPSPTDIFWPGWAYLNSKLANVIWTRELAKKLRGSGITANCLHPGIVDTEIWRRIPPPFVWIIIVILKLFGKTPVQGAQTTIHLAVADEVEGVTGKYFFDCKEFPLSRKVKDPIRAEKFWEICKKIVKIQPNDSKML